MAKTEVLDVDATAPLRRLVSLLQAGLTPAQAMQQMDASLAQMPVSDRALVDYVWAVATRAGGPMTEVFIRLIEVMQQRRDAQREANLAYASPRATARLVLFLPFIAIAIGELLGMQPLLAIFHSAAGAISVCLGLALLLVAKLWSDKMLRGSLPVVDDDAILLDGFVICMKAGLPPDAASKIAFEDSEFVRSLNVEAMRGQVESAYELAKKTGASMIEVIRSVADEQRKEKHFERANRLAKLSVKLMIPLGVAVLPAFVLLSIVPIAISLLVSSQIS